MRSKKLNSPLIDPRRGFEKLLGGRRTCENENPYLSARRTWNDHMQTLISSRQAWQVIGHLICTDCSGERSWNDLHRPTIKIYSLRDTNR